MYSGHIVKVYTVEPPNKGHLGMSLIQRCSLFGRHQLVLLCVNYPNVSFIWRFHCLARGVPSLCFSMQDEDLRSAVCLEQAAHAFLRSQPSMPRKYALHLVLAGNRYARAAQVERRREGGIYRLGPVRTSLQWWIFPGKHALRQ